MTRGGNKHGGSDFESTNHQSHANYNSRYSLANQLFKASDSFHKLEGDKLNFSFTHPSEPLLDADTFNCVEEEHEPRIGLSECVGLETLLKDKETLAIVFKALSRRASSNGGTTDSEPSNRELNDIIFNIDLTDLKVHLMKKKVLQGIDEELFLYEQSDIRLEAEKTQARLQAHQKSLQRMLNLLLGYEAMVSGLYSGLGTVSMKIICGFVGVLYADGIDKGVALWCLALSALILLYSQLANLFTLNNLLSMYPSLKAGPYYQSSIIITGILAGGICLGEFAVYSCSDLLMIALGTLVCMGGIYNKLQG